MERELNSMPQVVDDLRLEIKYHSYTKTRADTLSQEEPVIQGGCSYFHVKIVTFQSFFQFHPESLFDRQIVYLVSR